MKKILVPVGSNENALNTLQYAIDFAEAIDAKIYLVHVYTSSKISGALINVDHIIERDSKQILKSHLKNVDKKNVKIIPSTLKGHSIIDTLKQLIKLLKIDLIISSTKNDGADENIFIGKITGNIIKDTKIPALIIPAEAKFKPVKKILMAIKSGSINSETTLDILEKIHDRLGYRISLDNISKVTLDREKTADGLQALRWWKQGKIREIIDYCRADVEITRDLYRYGRDNGFLLFNNKDKKAVRVPVKW